LYGYSLQDPINGIDPYGLFCISPQLRDAIANGIGTTVGCAVTGGFNPGSIITAIALGAADGLITYRYGNISSSTITGAVVGATVKNSNMIARTASIAAGALSGSVAGALGNSDNPQAIGFGIYASAIIPPIADIAFKKMNPKNSAAFLMASIKGIKGGLISSFVTDGTSWLIDKYNEHYCN
jgi:hypothetical protein